MAVEYRGDDLVEGLGLGFGWHRFNSLFCHKLCMWPWASCLISLCLSSPSANWANLISFCSSPVIQTIGLLLCSALPLVWEMFWTGLKWMSHLHLANVNYSDFNRGQWPRDTEFLRVLCKETRWWPTKKLQLLNSHLAKIHQNIFSASNIKLKGLPIQSGWERNGIFSLGTELSDFSLPGE